MGGGSSVHTKPDNTNLSNTLSNSVIRDNRLSRSTLSPIAILTSNVSLSGSFKFLFGSNSPKLRSVSPTNNNRSGNISISSLVVPVYHTNPSTDYRIIKKIANGGFSTVHKAVSLSDARKRVAIKETDISKLSKRQLSDLYVEMNILSQLSHPGIVKFYSVYKTNEKVYMVMECLRGGELLDAICEREYYTEGDARRIMLQLTGAVEYMHSRKVIHRDIKPENIILESNSIYSNVKLIDFGFAILSTDTPSKHSKYMCGTPGYIAPEVLKDGYYSTAGDVWALGIMLYILLSGAMPFDGKNENRILAAKYPLPSYLFGNVSTTAKDLISKILVPNPSDRYTASEVLLHPWMLLPVSVPLPGAANEEKSSSGSSNGKENSLTPAMVDDKELFTHHENEPPNRLILEGEDGSSHRDIDITSNLEELRRLTAAQRWKSTIHKVVQSVRQQKYEFGSTPRTDEVSNTNSTRTYGSTPRTQVSSIRTIGSTPRTFDSTPRSFNSIASPRSISSPRSFRSQERSNSGSGKLGWGRFGRQKSAEYDVIQEEGLDSDENSNPTVSSLHGDYRPLSQSAIMNRGPSWNTINQSRTMINHMPRIPDDSESDVLQSVDSADERSSRQISPRHNNSSGSSHNNNKINNSNMDTELRDSNEDIRNNRPLLSSSSSLSSSRMTGNDGSLGSNRLSLVPPTQLTVGSISSSLSTSAIASITTTGLGSTSTSIPSSSLPSQLASTTIPRAHSSGTITGTVSGNMIDRLITPNSHVNSRPSSRPHSAYADNPYFDNPYIENPPSRNSQSPYTIRKDSTSSQKNGPIISSEPSLSRNSSNHSNRIDPNRDSFSNRSTPNMSRYEQSRSGGGGPNTERSSDGARNEGTYNEEGRNYLNEINYGRVSETYLSSIGNSRNTSPTNSQTQTGSRSNFNSSYSSMPSTMPNTSRVSTVTSTSTTMTMSMTQSIHSIPITTDPGTPRPDISSPMRIGFSPSTFSDISPSGVNMSLGNMGMVRSGVDTTRQILDASSSQDAIECEEIE